MIKQINNKKEKNAKGITLVALVVTIVVLLILAGITIMYVMGKDGIIQKAQRAKEKTELAKVNEIMKLACLEDVIEYEGKTTKEFILATAINKLKSYGYGFVETGENLAELFVQDSTGSKVERINLFQGETTESSIVVGLRKEAENPKYYVQVCEKWHELKIENKEPQLLEEGLDKIEEKTYTLKLTPPSTGVKVYISGTEITEKTTIVNGTELIITAGENEGNYNLKLEVEDEGLTKNIDVIVSTNPTYATSVQISVPNNKTILNQGEQIQLTATMAPSTATDTIVWSISSEQATISNNGLLIVDDDAEIGEEIEVTATVKRKGELTGIEDKYIFYVESTHSDYRGDLIYRVNFEDLEGKTGVTFKGSNITVSEDKKYVTFGGDSCISINESVVDPTSTNRTCEDRTICCWYKTTTNKEDQAILGFGTATFGGSTAMQILSLRYSNIEILNGCRTISNMCNPGNALDGEWHFMAGAFSSGTTLDWYYDDTSGSVTRKLLSWKCVYTYWRNT